MAIELIFTHPWVIMIQSKLRIGFDASWTKSSDITDLSDDKNQQKHVKESIIKKHKEEALQYLSTVR